MTTAEFVKRAGQHIAASSNPELDAIIPVARSSDIEKLAMPPYMRVLLDALFAEG